MGGFGGFGSFGWIGMILYMIVPVLLIVGLVVLVVWAVRHASGSSPYNGAQIVGSQSPKEIAQARYAKGEISREEYQQILVDLGH